MELFIYVTMHVEDATRAVPTVLQVGVDDHERVAAKNALVHFDAKACDCSVAEDKQRIIRVIDGAPGGLEGFNANVRKLATVVFANSVDLILAL